MRFITYLAALIATSAISFSSAKSVTDKNRDSFILKLTDECHEEVTKSELFKKCQLYVLDMKTLQDTCKDLLSDDCKNFYSDGLKYLPKCANDPLMKKAVEYYKETAMDYNIYYCTITSDGKACPSVEKLIEANSEQPKITNESHKLDCEYQVCIDNLIKTYQHSKNYSKLMYEMYGDISNYNQTFQDEFFDGVLEYLKSSECVPKNKDEGKLTSGTTSIRALGSLLILIFLYIVF